MSNKAAKQAAREINKRSRGKPRLFPTAEDFQQAIINYLEYCKQDNNRMPTISGFSRFCNTNTETVYMQEEYYPYEFSKMSDWFEDSLVNCNANKSIMGIFALKAKHGWQDGSQQGGLTINVQLPETEARARLERLGYRLIEQPPDGD